MPDFLLRLRAVDRPVLEADRRLLLGLVVRDFPPLVVDLTLLVACVLRFEGMALDAVELTLVAAEIIFSVLFSRLARFFLERCHFGIYGFCEFIW